MRFREGCGFPPVNRELYSARCFGQLREILDRVALVLQLRLGDAGFGELQRSLPLLRSEKRFDGPAADVGVRDGSVDQPLERGLGLIEVALLHENLPATQFVVVAATAFIPLAVVLLAVVDVINRFLEVVRGETLLNEMVEPGEAIGPISLRTHCTNSLRNSSLGCTPAINVT